MTLVNAETGEVVELADETEARRIADGIGVALARVNVATGDLVEKVATALHRRAWVALGHGSWDDLVAAEGWEFNPRTSTERAALAKVFRESGLSFRAIGKLVSASPQTVMRDTAGVPFGTGGAAPEVTTGTDGKTYPARRPEPVPEPEDTDETPTIEQRWAAVLTLHPYLADIPTRYKAEALAGAEALTQFDTTERARREEIFQRWARSRPDAERASQQAEQHTKAEHAGDELLDAIAVCERSLDAWMARADQLPPGHDMPVHVAAAAADLTRRLAETAQTPHLRSVQ